MTEQETEVIKLAHAIAKTIDIEMSPPESVTPFIEAFAKGCIALGSAQREKELLDVGMEPALTVHVDANGCVAYSYANYELKQWANAFYTATQLAAARLQGERSRDAEIEALKRTEVVDLLQANAELLTERDALQAQLAGTKHCLAAMNDRAVELERQLVQEQTRTESLKDTLGRSFESGMKSITELLAERNALRAQLAELTGQRTDAAVTISADGGRIGELTQQVCELAEAVRHKDAYIAQLAKKREPLTDEQLLNILTTVDPMTRRLPIGFKAFARAIEQAIKGVK